MPSTFTSNTGIELIADGEQSGLWGQTTNDNFDIVDRALNGSVSISLVGTTHTLTTSNGVLSDGQFAVLVFTGSPSGTNTVTIGPNTAQKTYFVTNSTAQTVVLSQGSGANVSVPAGLSKIVFTNGAGAGAAVFDITNTLSGTFTGNASTATALQTARTIGGVSFNGTANINLPGVNIGGNQNTTGSAASLTTPRTFTIGNTGKTFNGTANVAWSLAEIGVGTLGQQAANNVDINGGTIDGTVIGGSTPAAISGTTGSFSGNVGIGTSSPAAKLDVSADALIHGATVGRGAGGISTNTAVGSGALSNNTTGFSNTANGFNALLSNTAGSFNTANGRDALLSNIGGNIIGINNTANGSSALRDNTTGLQNTANGVSALRKNTTGRDNTANGCFALQNNTTGSFNTANGCFALQNNTTGSFNTANGRDALFNNTEGSNNIGIGLDAGRSTSPRTITTASNEICIGNNDHTGAFIKIAFTVTSDARDKAALAPIQHGLDFINALQPTEYQFKAGGRDGEADGIRRYGFLAQDVLAAEGENPVIVNNGDPDSLKITHDYLIPVLVNAVKELTAQVRGLTAEVTALKGQ